MTGDSSQREHGEEQDRREMMEMVAAALAKGRSEQEIVEELVRADWPEESAKSLVREALRLGRFQW